MVISDYTVLISVQ